MVLVFNMVSNTQDGGGVRSSQETASSRCHACRQIESSSNCSFLAFHCPLIKTCHLTHLNLCRCKIIFWCYCIVMKIAAEICIWNICLLVTKSAERAKSDPPPAHCGHVCYPCRPSVDTTKEAKAYDIFWSVIFDFLHKSVAWALQKSKDILKKRTQKHAQRDDPNKEPPLKMFALNPLFWNRLAQENGPNHLQKE